MALSQAVCISHKTKSCGLGRMEYHLINVYGCTESGIPMLRGGFRGGVVADTHPQLLMHILLNDDDGTPLLHYEFQDETISCDCDECPRLECFRRIDGILCFAETMGDLFEEVAPGVYVYWGREGDRIKMSNALAIDTWCVDLIALEILPFLVHELQCYRKQRL
ncbi:hypothetical protein WG66_002469 [Moniliophthora roreri]|nr:hypothetical protein WG66_002469 [Moniliophthora roreri]